MSVISIVYITARQSEFTTMKTLQDKSERNVPRFIGTNEHDFPVWSLRITAPIGGKKIVESLKSDEPSTEETSPLLPIILPALGENPLRAIHELAGTKDAWQNRMKDMLPNQW